MSSFKQAIICNTEKEFKTLAYENKCVNPLLLLVGMYFESCQEIQGCIFDEIIISDKVDRTTDQFIMLNKKVERRLLES